MKYAAALFDMDGVILDSEPLHEAAFRMVLENYGHQLTSADYKAHFVGRTDEAGLQTYSQSTNQPLDVSKLVDEKGQAFLEAILGRLQPYPGVLETIQAFPSDFPLALVTGARRLEAELALSAFGILGRFGAIVTAEDVKRGKPDPEGYTRAAELLSVPIEKCVGIEDSVQGIAAVNASGATSLAVTNTHTAQELAAQAAYVVDKLDSSLFS